MMLYPLFILAGGQSRRFGSDKARALINQTPLIQHVSRCLAPMVGSIFAVSQQGRSYEDLGIQTIFDLPHLQGPIAGIATALAKASQEQETWAWIVSCDLIHAKPAWGEQLLQYAHPPYKSVLFFEETWQPTFALYHCAALEDIQRHCVSDTNLSIKRLIQAMPSKLCSPPKNWSGVQGCNTRQQLQRAQGLDI